jgi:hypothetical protein
MWLLLKFNYLENVVGRNSQGYPRGHHAASIDTKHHFQGVANQEGGYESLGLVYNIMHQCHQYSECIQAMACPHQSHDYLHLCQEA